MIESNKVVGSTYASKMDQVLTKAISDWWNSLTKDEILAYLAEQSDVTADMLRNMLSNEQCTMGVGVMFSMNSFDALVDFHTDGK